jgi:GTP diphosphokinase / guanosine-3',5'-bis(diphosphate) 3'-diphosphatase
VIPSKIDPNLVIQAANVAAQWHATRRLKGAAQPYVNHVLEVAALVAAAGADQDTIIAALLHDAIEDQQISPETIAAQFCEHVAAIVLEVTDAARPSMPVASILAPRKKAANTSPCSIRSKIGRPRSTCRCVKPTWRPRRARPWRCRPIGAVRQSGTAGPKGRDCPCMLGARACAHRARPAKTDAPQGLGRAIIGATKWPTSWQHGRRRQASALDYRLGELKKREVPLEWKDHTHQVGCIVTNLQALETVLRYFLLRLHKQEAQFPKVADTDASVTYLTKYAFLGQLVDEYNRSLEESERQLRWTRKSSMFGTPLLMVAF